MIERMIARIDESRFDPQMDRMVFWGGVAMMAVAVGGTLAAII